MINMTLEEELEELEQIELQKQYEQMSYDADAEYYGEQE
jgi:hypothetical protein